MKKLIWLLPLILVACESSEDVKQRYANLEKQDAAACEAHGLKPDTEMFKSCMMVYAQNHAAEEEEALSRAREGTDLCPPQTACAGLGRNTIR